MKKVWNNAEAIREYRATRDAREGLELARALYRVFYAAFESGEISNADMAIVDEHFDPVFKATAEFLPHALLIRERAQLSALVTSNIGLVRKGAKRELRTRANNPDNLNEAIQEGIIGLLRAIEEFDETRGQFVTVAAMWIRHHVQTCAAVQADFVKSRPSRMPKAVAIAANKFRMQHGREPEPEEVGATRADWESWKDLPFVASLEDMGRACEEGGPREDTIADPSETPEEISSAFYLRRRLETVLKKTSPRNREIAVALFVDGDTEEEVAQAHGLTHQRVNQLRKVLGQRLRKAMAGEVAA